MASVWLQVGDRQWHVDEGTPEHDKLVLEGAVECADPTPKPKRAHKADNDEGEG